MSIKEDPDRQERFEVRVGDLPDGLTNEVVRHIGSLSTALILDGKLAGSGTFIKCGNVHGILTAHHVVYNPLERTRRFDFSWGSRQLLGLPLVDWVHQFDIPMHVLRCVDVGVPRSSAGGPDLAVIVLPELHLGEIKARKTFIDISRERELRLDDLRKERDGLWAAAGYVAQYVESHPPSHGFREIVDFPLSVVFTAVDGRSEDSEYDYITLNVDHWDCTDGPDSFGGMSGGGVWKLRLQKDRKTLAYCIEHTATSLAGVVFYQTLAEGKPMKLWCHAGKSIYEKVYEALAALDSK